MAEQSNIAWTDATFNPWIGCMKVSAGCDNCYAETLMDKRYHRVEWGQRKILGVAGSVGTRSRTSKSNWHLPVRWNSQSGSFKAFFGRRRRVFCSSLADVFDNQVDPQWRTDLWKLIWDTPDLDWLLLTKRPENIEDMLPDSWRSHANEWAHVWLGTTAEDQSSYDKRWPILREIPATVRFISYEPAIGPLYIKDAGPDWVICGGESGRGYRQMDPMWAALIKNDCCRLEIPFFMKQISGLKPSDDQIPVDLMLRQFPRSP